MKMRKTFLTLATASAVAAGAVAAAPAAWASTDTVVPQSGWQKAANGDKSFFVKGHAVVGPKLIKGTWRAFSARGVLQSKTFKLGNVAYYANSNGVLEARGTGGKFYYANGVKMTKADEREYRCIIKARKIAAKITNSSQSKAAKLKKCFEWVEAKYYEIQHDWKNDTYWPSVYAMDHFKNINGDCHSDAAAFSYLAYAIGYSDIQCCTDGGEGNEDNHAWAAVDGKVYDPLFNQMYKGGYYALPYSKYMTDEPVTSVNVPYGSPSHATASCKAAKLAKPKDGLRGSGSKTSYWLNGTQTKKAWVTVGGYSYYLKANGYAACGPFKVKGVDYVAGSDGALMTGSGTRTVEYSGTKYRVDSNGKAVAGWSSDKTFYCDATGRVLAGVWVVKGKFYAANSKGVYDKEKTAALRSYQVTGTNIVELLALLGSPKSVSYKDTSYTHPVTGEKGQEGVYKYAHFTLHTFLGESGIEYYLDCGSA